MRRHSSGRRGLALATAGVMLASLGLAACGSSSSASGTKALTWYINPDIGNTDPSKGGQASLAQICSKASGGKYNIKVQLLPNSASDQRIQLLRRLVANDSSMDLMSMDPAFVTEFASADLLAPVPASMDKEFKADRVDSAIKGATFDNKLIAVPFWANTQLLWYSKKVAKAAGLDISVNNPVTWAQVIDAAKKEKKQIGVQAKLYEGYSVWINALIAGAGGKIVDNPAATAVDTKLGINSPAGKDAARIISTIANSGLGGPAMGSSDETAALALFQSKAAAFLVNWPYTYAALTGDKSDVGAAVYPRTVAGKDAAPPFGGIDLAVGKSSKSPEVAYQATACITNEKNQAAYMAVAGNPASRKAAFTDPAVLKAFPNGIAATILKSLGTATPRPLSPYWGDISTGLQQQFSPPSSVNANTPVKAQKFITNVLKGKALL
ncbi:MAG: extracellular solute-binding protein [Actinomycetota bacterium]|nr:extracellular solute-binding protein [Actinomycetota bacterium]